MTIIVLGLLVLTLLFLVKPHLLNDRKAIKNPFSRPKIFLAGFVAIMITFVGFGPVLAATEPASVKEARIAQEAAKEASRQKAAADAAKQQQKQADAKKPVVKTETKVEVIPFETQEQNDASLAKGQTKVTTEGADGERTTYYSVTYIEGKETSRSVAKEVVTKEPVAKVIAIGTYVAPVQPSRSSSSGSSSASSSGSSSSSCNPNYSGCVPNVSYDLDCPDIGYTVQVLGYDVYRLDRDKDGWGCE